MSVTTGTAMLPVVSGHPSLTSAGSPIPTPTASASTNLGRSGSAEPTYPSDSVSSILENIHVVQHLLAKSVYEDNFLSMQLLLSQHARIWGEGSMRQSPPLLFKKKK